MRGLWPLLLLAGLAAALAIWAPSRQYLEGRLYNNIGSAYARGILVGKSADQATHWYRAAAERGSAAGQFNLGYALQKGAGIPRDEDAAAIWYKRAARQGMPEAANNLAMLYANPAQGRPNLVLARVWLKRGLPVASGDLEATMRENLAAMEHDMKPADLAASESALADSDL